MFVLAAADAQMQSMQEQAAINALAGAERRNLTTFGSTTNCFNH